ncbi:MULTISPECIES: hypothetical protein [Cupriavidus]
MPEPVQADRLLATLQRKRYFDYRFAKQVVQLFAHSAGDDGVRVQLFVNDLLGVVPAQCRGKAIERLIRRLVNEWAECPTVTEFREAVAEAALAEQGVSFASLLERARIFVATPPTQSVIADRWLEKVIWSSVRKIGRDRFALTTEAEWQQVVTRVILLDDGPLLAYEPSAQDEIKTTKRDFQSLLPRHDRA